MASARRVALGLLREWEQGHAFAVELIDRAIRDEKLAPRDRSQVQLLLYAVIRNRSLIDHFANHLASGKLDPKTRRILHLGLAEALLLDSAPHALVNETVKLAAGWSRRIVNAILRRALAEKETLLASVDKLPPEIRWSTPRWLWDRWVDQFGETDAEALCRWNNQTAKVYLRRNPLKPVGNEVLSLKKTDWPDFYQPSGELPKDALDAGLVYAQDPSTAAAIELLELEPGIDVLDACAAPGGKTFAIACAMQNQGRIVAADRDEKRVERMRGNLDRLGVSTAETHVRDWLDGEGDDLGQFDRILIDAPCSNTGVMQRRVDVRWRLSQEEINRLGELQQKLIAALAPRLKPGGRLVYSTCSIDAEENENVVSNAAGLCVVETKRHLPWQSGHDGAFAAALA